MEKSKSAIFMMNPFGYISKNKKDFLTYFIDQENTKNIDFLAFGYYNTSFYRELILLLCFSIVEKNISQFRMVDLNSLNERSSLIYIGEIPNYKGKYFKYKDIDKSGNVVLIPYKSTAGMTDSHSFPVKTFRKDFSMTEIDVNELLRKRNVQDIRNKFAEIFSIKKINRMDRDNIVILASKKLIDEISEENLEFNGHEFCLKEICNFSYLKSTGELIPCSASAAIEKPMVIFSSHIFSLIDYIEDAYDKSKSLTVYAVGDKWLRKAQVSNLEALEDVCGKEDIPLRIVSSVNSILNDEVLTYFPKITIWESSRLYKKNLPIVIPKLISCNKKFTDALDFFDDYLRIIEDENLLFFDKLLKNYLKMIFSQINNESLVIEEFMNKISEYGEIMQAPDLDKLHQAVYDLFDNRFGNKMKRSLDKLIASDEEVAIVVMDELLYEVKDYYREDRKVAVYALKQEITEDLYGKYEKIIVLSPYANERRRWMYSGLDTPIYLLIPEVQSKYLEYSLKKDLKLFNRMKEKNNFEREQLIQNYEKIINDTLGSIREHSKDKKENKENSFERFEKEYSNETEVGQERFERILEAIDDDEIDGNNPSGDRDNSATVIYGIDLLSGGHILGTSKGKIFVLDSQKKCKKIPISHLKMNHEILNFVIPYSDDFYRRNLRDKLENDLLDYEENSAEYLDIYWKSKLINFVKNRGLSVAQIKEDFELRGYRKRSENFYSSWTEIDKIRITPHDVSFIKYVGEVVGDAKISENPKKYFNASKIVKKKLYEEREKIINSFDGHTFAEISEKNIIKDISLEKIMSIEQIEIEEVSRRMTNRILKGRVEN